MKYITAVACATLSIVLVANADTSGKPRLMSEGWGGLPSLAASSIGWSAWDHNIAATAKDGMLLLKSDRQDTPFEYRWKSEWSVTRYICNVEIRPRGAAEKIHIIPEVVVVYFPNSEIQQPQLYTEHDVANGGKLPHSSLSPTDCGRVAGVYAGSRQ
jgi:hypothetical protein